MMGTFLEKAGLPAITGPNSLVLRFPRTTIKLEIIVRDRRGSPRSKKPCERGQATLGSFEWKPAAMRRPCLRPPWRRRRRRDAIIAPRRRKNRWSSGPWTLWGADRSR